MRKLKNLINRKRIKNKYIHHTKIYNKFNNLEMQNKIDILKELLILMRELNIMQEFFPNNMKEILLLKEFIKIDVFMEMKYILKFYQNHHYQNR